MQKLARTARAAAYPIISTYDIAKSLSLTVRVTRTASPVSVRVRDRGSGEAVLDARCFGFGVRSSCDDQGEDEQSCATDSANSPFPFSNCKVILGREFVERKGSGIH
jgi:hypothetical protein